MSLTSFLLLIWEIFQNFFASVSSVTLSMYSLTGMRRAFQEWLTPQKMKFSIKDFLSNVTKSAGNCGFDHIY